MNKVDNKLPKNKAIIHDAIFSNMNNGVIILDVSGNIVDLNPSAERIFSVRSADVLGQSFSSAFGTHTEALIAYKKAIGDEREEKPYEVRLQSQDTESFIELSISSLTNDGQDIGSLLIIRDITAYKQEQALAAQRLTVLDRLQQISANISNSLDIVEVLRTGLDFAVKISGANAGFIGLIEGDHHRIIQVAGNHPSEMVGNSFHITTGIIGRALRHLDSELVYDVNTDSDYVSYLATTCAQMAIPLITHGNLVGVLNLETDSPEAFDEEKFKFIKLLAERLAGAAENARLYTLSIDNVVKLQSLYDKVSALEQLKTDMIRIASHDLRNPLSTIRGYLDLFLMDSEKLSQEHLLFIDMMITMANRGEQIINDILSLERLQREMTTEPVDLRQLVDLAVIEHEFQAQEKSMAITLDITDKQLIVSGDDAQLHEAVVNLINNAIKYTPEGGKIQVKLQKQNNEALFEVVDNGYGIPVNLQEKLFQPFYRAISVETQHIEGTGLGLHLVKNIIERHGGETHFQSVHGEGSTFGFALSLIEAD